jgi:hypothetical protein
LLGSYLNRGTGYPGFKKPLQATAGTVARVGHGYFLPNILSNLTFIHDPAY